MEMKNWLKAQSGTSDAVQSVLIRLADGAVELSARIAKGSPDAAFASEVGENADGDAQKALDVIADELFMQKLSGTSVRWYASEEQENVVELNADGGLALAIDPLDGSSNIDVNVSIGTIFSVFEATGDADASFLRRGSEQILAGYAIYGPQTCLVFTLGAGVEIFTLDPATGEFHQTRSAPQIPVTHKEYAINASNRRHWDKPVLAFIADCELGEDGPLGFNSNMRWVASLVAEAHRILMRGGLFLYPGDARPGYRNGRLRHVYECAPIAFLIEQANGEATNGADRLLEIVPQSLHARTPLVFGSSQRVLRVATYYDLPDNEVSPLFGKRGLFSGAR